MENLWYYIGIAFFGALVILFIVAKIIERKNLKKERRRKVDAELEKEKVLWDKKIRKWKRENPESMYT